MPNAVDGSVARGLLWTLEVVVEEEVVVGGGGRVDAQVVGLR